jgi:hypothetical protein
MYVAYHHSSEIEYISENLLSRFLVVDSWVLYTLNLVVICESTLFLQLAALNLEQPFFFRRNFAKK